jgi:hypothetical protein
MWRFDGVRSTTSREHWIHLKTSNPIESTFATVPLRTKVSKSPGSSAAGLAMTYKLIIAAGALTSRCARHNYNCLGPAGRGRGLLGCGRRAAGWRTHTQEEARGAVAPACSDRVTWSSSASNTSGNKMH